MPIKSKNILKFVVAVAASVFITLMILGSTLNERAREGCMRNAVLSYAGYLKVAKDADRENLLANRSKGEEKKQHEESAEQAYESARQIKSITAKGPSEKDRRAFCKMNYPNPTPLVGKLID